MDDRYCIDNGAMIAYAGVLEYLHSYRKNSSGPKKGQSLEQAGTSVNLFGTNEDGMRLEDCTYT